MCLMRKFFALLLVSVPGIVLGCPDQLDWKDFSTVSLTFGNAGTLTLTRYTDALYARVESVAETKEMYQLNGGTSLYRGLTSSELTGPSPFFMLDMPVGVMLSLLTRQIKHPCEVNLTTTQFSYVLPAGNNLGMGVTNVTGSAIRGRDSVIVYDLNAIERGGRLATFKVSGKIVFSTIDQLSTDTVISDWAITRDTEGPGLRKVIQPSRTVRTIKDLRTLDFFESTIR